MVNLKLQKGSRFWLVFLGLALCGEIRLVHAEGTCAAVIKELNLPVKLESRGKPRRARWEQVDRVISDLVNRLQEAICEFKFEEIFTTNRSELYFPITNRLVRTVPEGSLQGLGIYNQSGERLGEYDSRATYSRAGGLNIRRSYTLHFFQFKDKQGQLQSTGNDLLLDSFLAQWPQIMNRTAIGNTGGFSK